MPIIPKATLNIFLSSLSTIPATVSTYTSTLKTLDNDFKKFAPHLPLLDLTSSQIRDILKNRSNVITVPIKNNPKAIPFFDYCLKTVEKNSTRCAVFKSYFSFLVVYELMGLSQPFDTVYSTWQPIWGNLKKGRVTDINELYEDIKTGYDKPTTATPIVKNPNSNINDMPRQMVIYGAPGNGKSKSIKDFLDGHKVPSERIHRVTFHPEMDYASFVGAYIPMMNGNDIVYQFQQQAFLDAYIQAVTTSGPVFLIIEEINRGNCAEIFGDIFQLLDRNEYHISDYAITTNKHIAQHLKKHFKSNVTVSYSDEGSEKIEDTIVKFASDQVKIKLPPNLFIWATMNVSDQSLFPIDAAFFRRWRMRYMPVGEFNKDSNNKIIPVKIVGLSSNYTWNDLHEKINGLMDDNGIPDKKLGTHFVKWDEQNPTVSLDDIVNKVIFYLYKYVFSVYSIEEKLMENKPFDKYFNPNKAFNLSDTTGSISEVAVEGFLKEFLKETKKSSSSNRVESEESQPTSSPSPEPNGTEATVNSDKS